MATGQGQLDELRQPEVEEDPLTAGELLAIGHDTEDVVDIHPDHREDQEP